MSISIQIADDQIMLREGLKALLEKEPDFCIVAEAGNGLDAVRLAGEVQPDVIVMNIGMPDMNGMEATRRILKANSSIKVLALSTESDRRFIVEMLESGACGYVMKDASFKQLADAMRAVASGETYLCPRTIELIIKDYLQRVPDGLPLNFASLTDRERELLQMVANGMNAKEIAGKLDISNKTVEVHRLNIMKKLNLFSIAELTKFAVREGLTSRH
jgi:DNA-binding NarL/FixJ family response regulator